MKGHRREPAPINQDASNLAHRAIGCAGGSLVLASGAGNTLGGADLAFSIFARFTFHTVRRGRRVRVRSSLCVWVLGYQTHTFADASV
jgi:hypothetical protein